MFTPGQAITNKYGEPGKVIATGTVYEGVTPVLVLVADFEGHIVRVRGGDTWDITPA